MILYGIDGLLFLFVQDYLSIGFHVFALYGIYKGFAASRELILINSEIGTRENMQVEETML